MADDGTQQDADGGRPPGPGVPQVAAEVGHPPGIDETPLAGGAPEVADERWWSDVEKRHAVVRNAAIVTVIVVLALVAGAAVTLLGPQFSGSHSATKAPSSGTPVATPGAVATPTGSAESSATSGTPSATSSLPATLNPVAPVTRAALVAYRSGGALWVSGESGESPRRVATVVSGPFALSPDGRTLAFVDGASKTLSLVDVGTHGTVVVGSAELEEPSWARDSSFVVYTALPDGEHDTVVRRVRRDGGGRVTLGTGAVPYVAPDGRVVAVSGTRGSSGVPIVVFAGGASRLIGSSITANAAAAATSTIAYCDAGSPGVQATARQPQVGVMGYDGTGKRTLVKRPAAGGSAFFGEIDISPDGKRIVYAETGDDGYSRIFVVPVTGGATLELSSRRDAYPVTFSADGAQLFYIDGNALQGEATRLMAVRLDGTERRVVVEGAGL